MEGRPRRRLNDSRGGVEHDRDVVPLAQHAGNAHVRIKVGIIDDTQVVAVSADRAITESFVFSHHPPRDTGHPSRPTASWIRLQLDGL